MWSCAQISWYFEIGRTYLEKPRYESVDKLIEPTPEQLAKIFLEIDEDDSGEVDLHEVHEALSHLWPCMDVQGFQRAFEAADLDASGHIDMEEFKHLLTFISASFCAVVLAALLLVLWCFRPSAKSLIRVFCCASVWFNEKRHAVMELEDLCKAVVGEDGEILEPEGAVNEEGFYFGCTTLGISSAQGTPITDGQARYLYQEQLSRRGGGEYLSFNHFLCWAVRHTCVTLKDGAPLETERQRRDRLAAEMSKELENMAGEYGDVHMVDLVSVLTTDRDKPAGGAGGIKAKLKAALKSAVRSALECQDLITKGIAHSTDKNESFPALTERSIRVLVQMCSKEEYFTGQNIITQGEADHGYFILRRGKVEVLIDGHRVRSEHPTWL